MKKPQAKYVRERARYESKRYPLTRLLTRAGYKVPREILVREGHVPPTKEEKGDV